jgi:signal transduction histidine kinase
LQAAQAHRLTRQRDERAAAEDVKEMITSLRRASEGVREAVYELRAGEVVGRALARAVEDLLVVERRRSPGIDLELAISEGVPQELPKEVCRDVLLVVREALANARRHAGARRVRVALEATDEEIRTEVSDDGAGFDPRESTEGVGLSAMRERSAALGGTLEVLSEPGKGTTVRLRFPQPS